MSYNDRPLSERICGEEPGTWNIQFIGSDAAWA